VRVKVGAGVWTMLAAVAASPKQRGRRKVMWLMYVPLLTVTFLVGAFIYFLLKEGRLDGVLGTHFRPASVVAAEQKQLRSSLVAGVPPPQKSDIELPASPHVDKSLVSSAQSMANSRPATHAGIRWPKLLDITPEYTLPDSNTVPSATDYPVYASLLSIIEGWNPDQPDPPSVFIETLQHFNYSDPFEREIAARFRDAEVPFKLYNVPEVDAITDKWSDSYLTEVFQRESHRVEVAEANHFMFWSHNSMKGIDPNWKPPTETIKMSFPEWRKIAADADKNKLPNNTKHYYFHANAPIGDKKSTFVARDLKFFSTSQENFFITNVPANKGIQCRFGMRGIIAETHYDGGRNMVAMLKGQKRYILSPPYACKYLGL
jgi:hypothetical protein